MKTALLILSTLTSIVYSQTYGNYLASFFKYYKEFEPKPSRIWKQPLQKFPLNCVINATGYHLDVDETIDTTEQPVRADFILDSDRNMVFAYLQHKVEALDSDQMISYTLESHFNFTEGSIIIKIDALQQCQLQLNGGQKVNLTSVLDSFNKNDSEFFLYMGVNSAPWKSDRKYHVVRMSITNDDEGLTGYIYLYYDTKSNMLHWIHSEDADIVYRVNKIEEFKLDEEMVKSAMICQDPIKFPFNLVGE